MSKTKSCPAHGGKREGAGRKARFGEPTTLVRVPESAKAVVVDFLDELALKRRTEPRWPDHLTPVKLPTSHLPRMKQRINCILFKVSPKKQEN